MKNRIAFPGVRFGGTSWVVHGGFAENMRRLSEDVSDMQFVLFDNAYGSNLPSKEEVRALADLCLELDMSCTVHFHNDVCISLKPKERVRCEDSCLRTLELFDEINPRAWILHLCGEQYGTRPSADMERWLELTARSVERIASASRDRSRICAETLDYDFSLVWPVVAETGISTCIDIGHLIKYGHSAIKQLETYMESVRALHIHGVMPDGTDHKDMSFFDKKLLTQILKMLEMDGREHVMTIEVFGEDYWRSVNILREFAHNIGREGYNA